MIPRVPSVVALLAVLAGCGDARPDEASFQAMDSAGIRIVTNPAELVAQSPTWLLDSLPTLTIGGGADPEVPLFRVSDVLPLDAGRVIIATMTPPSVRVFDADGRVVAELGRAGEGPGEYQTVRSLVRLASNTIGVWDPYRRRVSVFNEAGVHLRDLDLRDHAPMSAGASASSEEGGGLTSLLVAGTDLIVFAEGSMSAEEGEGIARPGLETVRVDSYGARVATYGPFPGLEIVLPGGFPRPLGARTYAATSGNRLVIGTGEATQYRVFDDAGTPELIVRWPPSDRRMAGTRLGRWQEFASGHPQLAGIVSNLPLPDSFPPHGPLLSGEEGRVWVGDYPGPTGIFSFTRADDVPPIMLPTGRIAQTRWLIFGEDGSLRASLQTPEGFEPLAVDEDHLWGISIDELGVEAVTAYRLYRDS